MPYLETEMFYVVKPPYSDMILSYPILKTESFDIKILFCDVILYHDVKVSYPDITNQYTDDIC